MKTFSYILYDVYGLEFWAASNRNRLEITYTKEDSSRRMRDGAPLTFDQRSQISRVSL